ncbi:MAG TPA: WXG100 family type VII secretion target [Nocardioides sp.]|nr:WXG100 family type VII secretion target [Nocardioides sp.]
MNFDGLRVDHGGLDTAAADLFATVREIDDRLNRLEDELAPLRSEWVGNAQQAYAMAKGRWDAAIAEMNELLGQTSKAVHQSNEEYRAADRRGAALFGG